MKTKKEEALIYIPFHKIQGIGRLATLKKNIKIYFNLKRSFSREIKGKVKGGLSFAGIGGPTTFMKNLQKYLDKKGFPYLNSPKRAKVLFSLDTLPKKILDSHKKRGGRVVQRLDGIYYPSKHQEKYVQLNKDIQDIYLNYSDFIIFQSQHSKDQCFALFGEKKNSQYTVIVNGVNKSVFYPEPLPRTELHEKIKFVTTGSFRNMDMVEPIIMALDRIQGKIDFEYFLIGPVQNKKILGYLNRSYLTYILEKDQRKLADLLRNSDIFIYSFLNPPCPNSVLEAISCGIPVVGFDSGAMAELLFFSKGLLALVSRDVFQKYEDFDPEKLAEKILLAVKNFSLYKKRAMEYSTLFSFEECGKKYMEVFQRLIHSE